MTKKDFLSLPDEQRDAFINGGGVIDPEQVVGTESGVLDEVATPGVFSPPVFPVLTDHKEGLADLPSPQPAPSSSVLQIDGIMIENPVELLTLLDEGIQSGRTVLHDWQVKIMVDFATGGESCEKPYQAVVRACNGSGKDKYIIASCVVWLCLRYRGTICPVTSSSGAQLDTQTCRYIKYLCERCNKVLFCGKDVWNIKYREYTLDFSLLHPDWIDKSQIFCFATDEAKKAEGYHPNETGMKMCIAVSEDKSVPDEINTAMNRCTGYTHRIHVSTPGLSMGHFYDYCNRSVMREDLESVHDAKPTDWIQYHVTAHMCSHIPKSSIAQSAIDEPGGVLGAAYQSKIEAEFGMSEGALIVIPRQYVVRSFSGKVKWIPEPFNTAGLDLSDGGAENVLCIRNGNKHIGLEAFRFDNTEDTIDYLVNDLFPKWDLNNQRSLIFGDCCGIGSPMLKSMRRLGWANIRFIDSRSKAASPKSFLNRGTELFFNVGKLFATGAIIAMDDQLLIKQLAGRYYKMDSNMKHQLLSKLEQKAKGYPSPDRADAFNLMFWNYKVVLVKDKEDIAKPFEVEEVKKKTVGDFNLKNWALGSGHRTLLLQSENKKKDFSILQDEINAVNNSRNN